MRQVLPTLFAIAFGFGFGLGPNPCLAAPQIELFLSPDITVTRAGLVVSDESVLREASGAASLVDLGALPDEAEISALHDPGTGPLQVSFATTTALPGGGVARPGQVWEYDGSVYSLFRDLIAEGVPDGAVIDAVSSVSGIPVFSFDTTVEIQGLVAEDQDVIGTNIFVGPFLAFDGVQQGVPRGLDLDAFHFDAVRRLIYVSFDTGGEIAGIVFADEDILVKDLDGGWSLAYDLSGLDPSWEAGDLDALHVPEPAAALLWLAGVGWLGVLRRHNDR